MPWPISAFLDVHLACRRSPGAGSAKGSALPLQAPPDEEVAKSSSRGAPENLLVDRRIAGAKGCKVERVAGAAAS